MATARPQHSPHSGERPMDHAKHPRAAALQGPYGHPFHPILVTIPIGAWVASLVFDVASLVSDSPRTFAEGAYWLMGIGIVGAVLAAVVGLMDLSRIPRGTRTFRTGVIHMLLNLSVVGLYAVNMLWRRSAGVELEPSGGMVALNALSLAILSASGWLGGTMAYKYGVRVADESTQAEAYR